MTGHRLGIGFNRAYVDGTLPPPPEATYLEAGVAPVCSAEHVARFGEQTSFSLHIARAPLSDDASLQHSFIDAVCALPRAASLESVGFHLCGPYRHGLGRWGLGSEFAPTSAARDRATRFLDSMRTALGTPLLVENANYYERSLAEAQRTIFTTNEIARDAGVMQILDLAHLAANAHNIGVEPATLLGAVDLSRVRVLHVSGIVEGRDGLWHDGHSQPVHPAVWDLLSSALANAPVPLSVVLEHTDAVWAYKRDVFQSDLARLLAKIDAPPGAAGGADRPIDKIALGYLANIVMPEAFPELVETIGAQAFQDLVRLWGKSFQDRVGPEAIVSFSALGMAEGEFVSPQQDFAAFVERELLENTSP